MSTTESPATVHGRLLEAVHVAGYTLGRAKDELIWLLEDERWRGIGFESPHALIESVSLREFRITAAERKEIAKALQQYEVSQRATARMLGVDEGTVRNDLRPAEDSARAPQQPSSDADADDDIAEDSAPRVTVAITPPPAHIANDGEQVAQASREQHEREQRNAERRARQDAETPTPVETPGFPTGPFRTIVIDPPWPIEKIILDRRPVEKETIDYPTWTLDQIRDDLPVARLADERGAHVYLWVTHKFMPFGMELFAAWGVRYECTLTWIKPTAQPLWWKYNTEHCLFGKVGSLAPLVKGTPVGFTAPQQRHSHKPAEFFELVRKVSPGPRITVFDGERDDFVHWGVPHRGGADAA